MGKTSASSLNFSGNDPEEFGYHVALSGGLCWLAGFPTQGLSAKFTFGRPTCCRRTQASTVKNSVTFTVGYDDCSLHIRAKKSLQTLGSEKAVPKIQNSCVVVAWVVRRRERLLTRLTRPSHASQNERCGTRCQSLRSDVRQTSARYDKLEMDRAIVAAQVQETGRIFLPTSTGGFDITLTPHDIRAATLSGPGIMDGVWFASPSGARRALQGVIAGMPDGQPSHHRQRTFEGLIITAGPDSTLLKPQARYSATAGLVISSFINSPICCMIFSECGVLPLGAKGTAETSSLSSNRSGSSLRVGRRYRRIVSRPPSTIDLATDS